MGNYKGLRQRIHKNQVCRLFALTDGHVSYVDSYVGHVSDAPRKTKEYRKQLLSK